MIPRPVSSLAVAVAVMILGAGFLVLQRQPVEVAASATVVFVGSPGPFDVRVPADPTPLDPRRESLLNRFRDSTVVADLFAKVYESDGVAESLRTGGLRGELDVSTRSTVASPTPDHGPVLVVRVVSRSGEDASAGVELVLVDLQRRLDQWQSGADERTLVGFDVVARSHPGTPLGGSRARYGLAVSLVAFLAFVLVRRAMMIRAGGPADV